MWIYHGTHRVATYIMAITCTYMNIRKPRREIAVWWSYSVVNMEKSDSSSWLPHQIMPLQSFRFFTHNLHHFTVLGYGILYYYQKLLLPDLSNLLFESVCWLRYKTISMYEGSQTLMKVMSSIHMLEILWSYIRITISYKKRHFL